MTLKTSDESRLHKRWTIRDIACEAGVSSKTVSHVLNGRPGVKRETRARVMKIIQDVGYYPYMGARRPQPANARAIGVTPCAPPDAVPLSRGFFQWLHEELFRVFGSRGFYVTFDMNPYAEGLQADYARGVWQQTFQACVLAGPLATDDTTVARIHDSGIPYVASGRLDSLPECSCATVDYEEGTYLSTKYLIDRGHTRVGMLKAFAGYQPGVERRRGYLRAIGEAGLPLDENLIRAVSFGARNIASMVHRILDNRGVTALVDCSGTEDAAALREGARRAGRVPGEDFEVVAWTYANDSVTVPEAAAHLWMPVREATADGLEQLAAWIAGDREGPIHIVYRPTLYETADLGEVESLSRLFETRE